jgi:hypothetical protein
MTMICSYFGLERCANGVGSRIDGCAYDQKMHLIQQQEVVLAYFFKDVAREHINLGSKASQLRHLLTVRSRSQERNARSLAPSFGILSQENPV